MMVMVTDEEEKEGGRLLADRVIVYVSHRYDKVLG